MCKPGRRLKRQHPRQATRWIGTCPSVPPPEVIVNLRRTEVKLLRGACLRGAAESVSAYRSTGLGTAGSFGAGGVGPGAGGVAAGGGAAGAAGVGSGAAGAGAGAGCSSSTGGLSILGSNPAEGAGGGGGGGGAEGGGAAGAEDCMITGGVAGAGAGAGGSAAGAATALAASGFGPDAGAPKGEVLVQTGAPRWFSGPLMRKP
jgi:hypothetical protein